MVFTKRMPIFLPNIQLRHNILLFKTYIWTDYLNPICRLCCISLKKPTSAKQIRNVKKVAEATLSFHRPFSEVMRWLVCLSEPEKMPTRSLASDRNIRGGQVNR